MLKGAGVVSSFPENYGCDIAIIAPEGKIVGIQRKLFPDDLMASLSDGRLPEQLQKMRGLDRAVLVLEGYGQWTTEGQLIHRTKFNRNNLYGLVWSLFWEFGVVVIQVGDMEETLDVCKALEAWVGKKDHVSLLGRPAAPRSPWGSRTNADFALHFLTGAPDLGPKRAKALIDHCGRVPLTWTISREEMVEVPGIGPKTAERLFEMFEEG